MICILLHPYPSASSILKAWHLFYALSISTQHFPIPFIIFCSFYLLGVLTTLTYDIMILCGLTVCICRHARMRSWLFCWLMMPINYSSPSDALLACLNYGGGGVLSPLRPKSRKTWRLFLPPLFSGSVSPAWPSYMYHFFACTPPLKYFFYFTGLEALSGPWSGHLCCLLRGSEY